MSYSVSLHSSHPFISTRLPFLTANTLHRFACRLPDEDREDCAVEFAERMLSRHTAQSAARQSAFHSDAWLDRCARNHAEDFCRRRRRWMRREVAWPEHEDEDGARTPWEPASHDTPCDAVTLRRECAARVMQAVQRLAPTPRDLFLRHCLHGETLTELADATGKTPDAVGKVIKRACATLRATLEQQGMTEADACEYLAAMQRGRGGLETVGAARSTTG